MTTLLALKARVADFTLRPAASAQTADAIASAVAHYRGQRFWFNVGTALGVTVAGVEVAVRPAAVLSVDSLTRDDGAGDVLLRRIGAREMDERQAGITNTVGQSLEYCEVETGARLWPVPQQVYTLTWRGLLDIGLPASDEGSTAWTDAGAGLICARAVGFFQAMYVRDPQAVAEAAALAGAGQQEYSQWELRERVSLRAETTRRLGTGRIRGGW